MTKKAVKQTTVLNMDKYLANMRKAKGFDVLSDHFDAPKDADKVKKG